MKALAKAQVADKQACIDKMNAAHDALEKAVEKYNEGLAALAGPIEDAVRGYEETVNEAREFCENVAGDAVSYFDERSEKWQESDTGQTYSNFKGEWENVCFDDVTIDLPDDIECPDNQAELLEQLPDEVDPA